MTKQPTTTDEKLDSILHHLERMDKRDRLRTWGGFFRGLLGLIPLFIFLYGAYYTYYHFDALLEKIAKEAAEQAAVVTSVSSDDFMEQIQGYFQ